MRSFEAAGGVLFAVGVGYVLANLYIFFVHTPLFPVVFVCQFIPLVCYRILTYYHYRWHHYCLDFCYCLNALHIVYVLFMPHNRWLFTCVFILTNGPVLYGALVFTNKLVFHDIESMFSVIMHLGPALATHAERFYWSRNDFVCPGAGDREDDCPMSTQAWSLWAVPVAVYFAHMVAYTLYVWVLPIHGELRKDPRYDNTFLYIRQTYAGRDGSGPIHALFNMFGSSMPAQYCAFALMNLVMAGVTCVLSVASFHYRLAHVAQLVVVGFSTAFFAGTFYFHFFSNRYVVKFFAPKPWTLFTDTLKGGFPLPFLPASSATDGERDTNSDCGSSKGAQQPSKQQQKQQQQATSSSPSSSEATGATDSADSVSSSSHMRSAKVMPHCSAN